MGSGMIFFYFCRGRTQTYADRQFNLRSHISRKHEYKQTLVKKGATIGANATIVCGNTIGRYAFISAGAVVTQDVPDHALVLGNPAKVAGWMCECGHRLNFQESIANCPECGKGYSQTNDGLRLFDHINARHDNPLLNNRDIHAFS